MPYRFDFDPVNEIFRCQAFGDIDDQALLECHLAATECARQVRHRRAILEFVEITSFEISTALVSFLAASQSSIPNQDVPRAIVAPSDLIYGKCRSFEILGGHTRPQLHIVRSLAEAYACFGVQNPQFTSIKTGLASSAHE